MVGLEKEDAAIKMAVDVWGQDHLSLEHQPVGLVVRGDLPHLGASPDGFLVCRCPGCPVRVLEVKCPYSIRNDSPTVAECFDAEGNIKKSHKYYAQVQGQLLITGLEEAVFCVYTNMGMHMVVICRDDEFNARMLSVLDKYYKDEVLPALLAR